MNSVVHTTTLRSSLSDVLEAVENKKPECLLVSRRGKTRAALVNLDLLEDLFALSSKRYLKSIQDARKQVKNGQIFTHEEAFGEL